MNCYIEVFGEGKDATCSITYEHDHMTAGTRSDARSEAYSRAREVEKLLFGYPELQEQAKALRTAIADAGTYPWE